MWLIHKLHVSIEIPMLVGCRMIQTMANIFPLWCSKLNKLNDLPEREFISIAVSHISRNSKQLHENCSQVKTFTALGIEKLQNLRNLDCKLIFRKTWVNKIALSIGEKSYWIIPITDPAIIPIPSPLLRAAFKHSTVKKKKDQVPELKRSLNIFQIII